MKQCYPLKSYKEIFEYQAKNYITGGPAFLAHTKQKVINIVGLRPYGQHFLWDMNNTKWCIGLYIEFRQSLAKETFSYDEYLKS